MKAKTQVNILIEKTVSRCAIPPEAGDQNF